MGLFPNLDRAAAVIGLEGGSGGGIRSFPRGTVKAVNADGSYQVQLNESSVSTRCARGCDAFAGDSVFVAIKDTGKSVAVARLGGILDLVYPVGAVYMSFDPTSPAQLFGGTWAPITGRFLYANASTATGGSNTHALTAGEGPSHNHIFYLGGKTQVGYGISGSEGSFVTALASTSSGSEITIGYAGGGQPHNNMPAYQSVYAWRRTS